MFTCNYYACMYVFPAYAHEDACLKIVLSNLSMSAQYYLVLHIYVSSTFDNILDKYCIVIDYCDMKSSVTILQRFKINSNNYYYSFCFTLSCSSMFTLQSHTRYSTIFQCPFITAKWRAVRCSYKNEIQKLIQMAVNCIFTLSLGSFSAPLLTRSLAASTRPSSAATCSGV